MVPGGWGVCGEEWRSRWFGVAVVEIAAGKMPDPRPILLEPGDFSTIFVAGDRRFPARDAKITILRLLGNLKKKVEMVRHHSIRQHPAPTKHPHQNTEVLLFLVLKQKLPMHQAGSHVIPSQIRQNPIRLVRNNQSRLRHAVILITPRGRSRNICYYRGKL